MIHWPAPDRAGRARLAEQVAHLWRQVEQQVEQLELWFRALSATLKEVAEKTDNCRRT